MSPLPPRPNKPSEQLQDVEVSSPQIIDGGESTSDDEVDENYGYELLPQEPEPSLGSTVVHQASMTINFEQYDNPDPGWQAFQQETFQKDESRNIELDDNQVHIIKSVMNNIKLPVGAEPAWAKSVPEEEWKAHIMSKINDSKEILESKSD